MQSTGHRVMQDLLDASLVRTGERLNLKIAKANISNIVNEAIGDRSSKDLSRIVKQVKDLSGFWDADALQRSIENLIGNAFKYGDRSTPVTISVEEGHGRVMVSVHNLGNPIPVEQAESLFQVFRRAEASKNGAIQGWGIGLALARSTSEQMGGSLGMQSSFELGTTFTIDIPKDARPFDNAPTSNGGST